ncbi:Os10g0358750 [Oryza sativa Japonica Group]|uniref:Os10g0358750 protein n=1 Tax=Oryza sativa subsp. japonica TaxID=39947 RepID=A0A0P0XT74_ORYSJ|nr:Os10g0358750 [Oryza sativa Japonica Group]
MLRIDRAWKSVKPTSSAGGRRGLMQVELLRPVAVVEEEACSCRREPRSTLVAGDEHRHAVTPPSQLERASSAPYAKGNSRVCACALSLPIKISPPFFCDLSISICKLLFDPLPCNCEAAAIDTAGERDTGIEAGEEQLRDITTLHRRPRAGHRVLQSPDIVVDVSVVNQHVH